MRRFSAAFLDRDGTVMRDSGYPSSPADVELLPGAARAIARLNELEVPVVLVTNQSGIGRGILDEAAFRGVQDELARQLGEAGARLDAVYHCPHDPGRTTCRCRKPAGELFERAARDLGISLERALFIGDRPRDVAHGIALGAVAIQLASEASADAASTGARTATDLAAAVEAALRAVGTAR